MLQRGLIRSLSFIFSPQKKPAVEAGTKHEEDFCLWIGLGEVNDLHRVSVAKVPAKDQTTHAASAAADVYGIL